MILCWFPEQLFGRKFHPHTAEIEKVTGNTSPNALASQQPCSMFDRPHASAICAAKTATFPRITETITARRIQISNYRCSYRVKTSLKNENRRCLNRGANRPLLLVCSRDRKTADLHQSMSTSLSPPVPVLNLGRHCHQISSEFSEMTTNSTILRQCCFVLRMQRRLQLLACVCACCCYSHQTASRLTAI